MFENIKATADTFTAPVAEKTTQQASPAEQKTTSEQPNASEGAKTQGTKEGEELRFDKHSRFKELIDERDKYRTEASDYKSRYESLTRGEQNTAKQEASAATGVAQSQIPNFQTVEELVTWVQSQTSVAQQKAVEAYKAEQESSSREAQEIDSMIANQLDELATSDERLMNKDGRDELLKFALENELTDLKIAHNLFQKINTTKVEGVQKGEEIARRKENSGPKSTASGNSTQKASFRRGQSLSDVIAEAKANLTK